MAKRSLKASTQGIKQAKQAFERTGWTQEYLAAEVGLSTRQSVWKFFSGRAIERHIFIDLCFQLNLDWQDIADLPQPQTTSVKEEAKEESSVLSEELNLDELVQSLRSQLQGPIQAQCGTLQSSFEFAQPLHLEHIYTSVNLLPNLSNQRWLEVADLQSSLYSTESPSLTIKERQTIPAMKAITAHPKLVILGKPGAGKSTLLQHLALQCSQGKFSVDCIPVYISLRTWATHTQKTEDFSLLNYICHSWNLNNISTTQVEALLQKGKLFILLDGLDEVPQQDNEPIVRQIQSFSEFYYQNQIIVTCRLAAQQFLFRGFTYVELADFNSTQIETFAQKWFIATEGDRSQGMAKAEQFLQQLQRKENRPLRELVVTPILLSLICSVFQERCSFPTKRAKLYQEGLEILLVRWDRARGIQRDLVYRQLSLSDKIKLLSQIAAITFERGDYFFEKNEVLQIIADFLMLLPNANTEAEALRLDSEAILKSIQVQHGLLVERARGIYSFSHLTFHEYLTARKIVATQNSLESTQSLQQLASYLTQSQWREVILLTISMLPSADLLLQAMKGEVDKLVAAEPKLQDFLQFLDKKARSLQLSYSEAAVRAFYFGLFQNRDLSLAVSLEANLTHELSDELALDLALARALVSATALVKNPDIKQILNFSFALELEKSFPLTAEMEQALQALKQQLPDLEIGKEKLIAWWQNNGRDWLVNFRSSIDQHRYFGRDWTFERQQQKLLQQYYHANQFLVECLSLDAKITPAIKTAIESNILGAIE
ncbi:MAG: NACHT domain-containing NTPase [Xenococcaceae cyanobacterium]